MNEGGAIDPKKIKRRAPKKSEKRVRIDEAIQTQIGGAIDPKKVKRRSPKKTVKREKIEQALSSGLKQLPFDVEVNINASSS